MKEKPILFNGEMVRAILDGRKTQTRRIVKGEEALDWLDNAKFNPEFVAHPENYMCPYGNIGDRLWVREAFCEWDDGLVYAATCADHEKSISKFKPSIHMPRLASRITLKIINVRIERLQDISEEDAKAEGITISVDGLFNHREEFYSLWQSIYKNWDENPWVWVIEFKRI